MSKPLVNKKYILEKFPGKGGWTFARIPEVMKDKRNPFGWVRVKGTIDGELISKYHLMPMGDGNLFLPVKAAIRKKIGKQAGDTVHVILYPDNDALEIPQEFMDCLQDEPEALAFFQTLTDSQQKYFIDWVYSAKQEATKVSRLLRAVGQLQQKKKFHDADKEAE